MQIQAEDDVLAMADRCRRAHGSQHYANRLDNLSAKARMVLDMFAERRKPDYVIDVLAWQYHDVRADQLTEEDIRIAEVELIKIIREIRNTLDC